MLQVEWKEHAAQDHLQHSRMRPDIDMKNLPDESEVISPELPFCLFGRARCAVCQEDVEQTVRRHTPATHASHGIAGRLPGAIEVGQAVRRSENEHVKAFVSDALQPGPLPKIWLKSICCQDHSSLCVTRHTREYRAALQIS